MTRLLLTLFLLLPALAHAQPVPATGCPPSSLTGCTIAGPLSVGGTLTLSVPGAAGVGSIVNNVSTYNWTSTPARLRFWESAITISGTLANATQETNFYDLYATVAGGSSQPNVTATISGGAIVSPLTVTAAGSGLTNGTYSLYFQGGGGTGAVGAATVSGGAVTSAACSPCGSGYTSAPAVGIIIGTVGAEAFNIVHPYFQSDSGVYFSNYGEAIESSALNNGIINIFEAHNAQFNNGPIGIIGNYIANRCAPVNQNPVHGSFGFAACIYIPALTSGASSGSGGAITATQSGGSVTLSIATAGSGYPNGTYDVTFSGGGCATLPVAQFTVTGGSITGTTLTSGGTGCSSNPTTGLYFGSLPTNDYAAQISDQYSTFSTLGNINIGSVATLSASTRLGINTNGNSTSEYAYFINAPGHTLSYLTAAGNPFFPTAFTSNAPVCSLASGQFTSTCYVLTVTKTTNYSIPGGITGTHFNNIGAAGTVTFTLPAAAAGLNYCFAVAAAQAVQVAPLTSDVIYVNSSVSTNGTGGGYVTDSTPYGSICLETHAAGTWFARSYSGTWTTH